MKYFKIAIILAMPVFAMPTAQAADLPQPVAALIGPGIGYLLGQSDLCQWNLNGQIKTTYQNIFAGMGLSTAQQSGIWQAAAVREAKLDHLPFAAKNGMRKGTCGPDSRATLEAQLSN